MWSLFKTAPEPEVFHQMSAWRQREVDDVLKAAGSHLFHSSVLNVYPVPGTL